MVIAATKNGNRPRPAQSAVSTWQGLYARLADGWEPERQPLPVGDVEKTLAEWGYAPIDLELGHDRTAVHLQLYADRSGDLAASIGIGKKGFIVQTDGLPAFLPLVKELEPLFRLANVRAERA
jgi:hypothetical protein